MEQGDGRRGSSPEVNIRSSSERLDDTSLNSVVLRMSPMMKKHKFAEKRYSTGQILDNIYSPSQTNDNTRRHTSAEVENTLSSLEDNLPDFVHVATFTQLPDVEAFLSRLLQARNTTVALDIGVSEASVISVSFQKLKNFNQEFMMLNLQ